MTICVTFIDVLVVVHMEALQRREAEKILDNSANIARISAQLYGISHLWLVTDGVYGVM